MPAPRAGATNAGEDHVIHALSPYPDPPQPRRGHLARDEPAASGQPQAAPPETPPSRGQGPPHRADAQGFGVTKRAGVPGSAGPHSFDQGAEAGRHLDRGRASAHIPNMLIDTETTPNPSTLKFLPGRSVMEAGTRDFATPADAEASPLAEAIFSTGEVTGVFFGRDFISVTAAPGVEWSGLKPEVEAVEAV